jgi:hypothetical protein
MAALRSFTYLPMEKMGHVFARGVWNVGEAQRPDFMAGPYRPPYPTGDYDEFGWRFKSGVLDGEQAGLIGLHGASVQRQSLGRDRYHIEMEPGICARDSYHDGDWLAPHIGERLSIGLKSHAGAEEAVHVNVMADAPIDQTMGDAVLISHFWMENYAHALLETCSRFWPWADHGYLLNGLPVIWDCTKPWQRELAEIVCPEGVVPLPANKVKFSTLYVPSFHSQIGQSPQSVQWLRWKFNAPTAPGKKRLYVSRRDANERRVVNEADVIALLAPMGFEVATLTGLTVAEQRDRFGEAECVVMPHGAGCANMIFAGTGTKIIEFVPKSYQHHMFWHIAKWSGHWYGRLICEDGQNKDMTVDIPALRRALEAAGL